ncbi:hypothetical protein JTE90_018839 [Oedothorax gibbosus]|uniref:Uncharacterized protein n=1 Tax=Oedothorax gibbosus TaxID=931172 RepID=A0AAV6UVN5_9ARAC|nr:hypothetical protein JTE90_018839 [Oedothorax gibbosus]
MITINRTKTGLKTKTTKLKNFVENFELDTSNDLKKLSLEEKLNNTSDVLNHIVELRTKVCELPEDVNIDNALEELENLEDTLSEIKMRRRRNQTIRIRSKEDDDHSILFRDLQRRTDKITSGDKGL